MVTEKTKLQKNSIFTVF